MNQALPLSWCTNHKSKGEVSKHTQDEMCLEAPRIRGKVFVSLNKTDNELGFTIFCMKRCCACKTTLLNENGRFPKLSKEIYPVSSTVDEFRNWLGENDAVTNSRHIHDNWAIFAQRNGFVGGWQRGVQTAAEAVKKFGSSLTDEYLTLLRDRKSAVWKRPQVEPGKGNTQPKPTNPEPRQQLAAIFNRDPQPKASAISAAAASGAASAVQQTPTTQKRPIDLTDLGGEGRAKKRYTYAANKVSQMDFTNSGIPEEEQYKGVEPEVPTDPTKSMKNKVAGSMLFHTFFQNHPGLLNSMNVLFELLQPEPDNVDSVVDLMKIFTKPEKKDFTVAKEALKELWIENYLDPEIWDMVMERASQCFDEEIDLENPFLADLRNWEIVSSYGILFILSNLYACTFLSGEPSLKLMNRSKALELNPLLGENISSDRITFDSARFIFHINSNRIKYLAPKKQPRKLTLKK